jgi:glutamate racemase
MCTQKKIDDLQKAITLHSLATPLLAPMVEEGFFNNNISESVITAYLSDPHLQRIKALILGCTHYPLIKKEIGQFYQNEVEIIDSSEIVASYVKKYLAQHGLLNDCEKPYKKFFVSDYTRSFEASTKIFFGKQVRLEQYPLWE